jgi:hypothetical protein
MINPNEVYDSIVQRLAASITVTPSHDEEWLYEAAYEICERSAAPIGHPYCLTARAQTPARAITTVVSMIAIWLCDPTSRHLDDVSEDAEMYTMWARLPETEVRQ